MPEGPEVATFADDLHKYLENKLVTKITYDPLFKHVKNFQNFKPGGMIKKVTSHGKNIIFTFEDGSHFISFLGLEGAWYLSDEMEDKKPLFQIFTEDIVINYRDSRHFGFIEFIEDYEKLFKRLDHGLDLLFGGATKEEWEQVFKDAYRRLRSSPAICEFLMDSRFILGIGNYLRAEILYFAEVPAFKKITDLTVEEKERLRKVSLQKIKQAYAERGASLRSYRDFYGNKGNFKVFIYNNKIAPDGRSIKNRKDKDDRTIWYCE